jgi:hypothetical protein
LEVWLQRLGMDTVVLANTIVSEAGEGELVKERMIKSPGVMPGFHE